jgi:hypothetical protein
MDLGAKHTVLIDLRISYTQKHPLQLFRLAVLRVDTLDDLDQVRLCSGKDRSDREVDLSHEMIVDEGAFHYGKLGIRCRRAGALAKALHHKIISQITDSSAKEHLSVEAVGVIGSLAGDGGA